MTALSQGEPMPDSIAVLHVCTTCRAGQELAEGDPFPGALLHAEIARQLRDRPAQALCLREVKCLSSCPRGAAAAISMPGKWSYLLGDLTQALVPDLLDYCASYAASKTGTVLPSRRAASLQSFILGRFPGQEIAA
jgi:predicted metal-binding protein